MVRRVALVTGASRGIGKAIAVRLAREGYAVAVTARTVHEGEGREHSSTLARSDTSPLPGSLDATARSIRDAGGEVLALPADLLDRDSLRAAVATLLDTWARVDVLVNNGRYVGPGHMDRFLDTPIEVLDAHLQANVVAPMLLAQLVLPGMVERGGGTVVHLTSGAGMREPDAPAGAGGWGMGYAVSKGGAHRIAGMLAVELADRGIRAFNVQPGFIATERIAADMAEFGFDAGAGAPPEVVAAVVAWLLSSPDAEALNGTNVEAQDLCRALGLLPGWP